MADEAPEGDVIELSRPARWVAGVGALAVITMVFILMWRGAEGAAVVALVAVAGVAALLSLVGVLPTRLVIGGHEAHWRNKARTAERVAAETEAEVATIAEVLPPDLRQMAEEVVEAARADQAEALARERSTLSVLNDWDRNAMTLLILAAANIGAEVQTTQSLPLSEQTQPGVRRFDARVSREGRTVDVDVRRNLPVSVLRTSRMMADTRNFPLLYISDVTNPETFIDGEAAQARTAVVGLNHDQIKSALSYLLKV